MWCGREGASRFWPGPRNSFCRAIRCWRRSSTPPARLMLRCSEVSSQRFFWPFSKSPLLWRASVIVTRTPAPKHFSDRGRDLRASRIGKPDQPEKGEIDIMLRARQFLQLQAAFGNGKNPEPSVGHRRHAGPGAIRQRLHAERRADRRGRHQVAKINKLGADFPLLVITKSFGARVFWLLKTFPVGVPPGWPFAMGIFTMSGEAGGKATPLPLPCREALFAVKFVSS